MSNLLDTRCLAPHRNEIWAAHLVRAADVARAVATLGEGSPGADGRREILAAHPQSKAPALGLAPAIAVSFGILLPGERTRLRRRNASSFSLGLGGQAMVHVRERELSVGLRDGWNTPGMQPEQLENHGDVPFTYVTYSNAPLLQRLDALHEELDPPAPRPEEKREGAPRAERAKDVAGQAIAIGDDGAMILPYEHLVDPDFVDSRSLLWRWQDVRPHLGHVPLAQAGLHRPAAVVSCTILPPDRATAPPRPSSPRSPPYRRTSSGPRIATFPRRSTSSSRGAGSVSSTACASNGPPATSCSRRRAGARTDMGWDPTARSSSRCRIIRCTSAPSRSSGRRI